MSRPRVLFFVAFPPTFADLIPLLVSKGLEVVTHPLDCPVGDAILASRPEVLVIEHFEKSSPDALKVAIECKKFNAALPIVIATTESSEELAIRALRAGLQDYVKLPSSPETF